MGIESADKEGVGIPCAGRYIEAVLFAGVSEKILLQTF